MGVKSDLENINALLMAKAQESAQIETRICELKASVEAEANNAAHSMDAEIEKWNALKNQVLVFYNIASENTSNVIDPYARPAQPDLEGLNVLIGSIRQSNTNDPNAYRAVDLVSQYLAYAEDQIRRVQADASRLERSVRDAKQREIQQLEARRARVVQDVTSIVRGSQLKGACVMLERVVSASLPSGPELNAWKKPNARRPVLAGFERHRMRVPRQLASELKATLGRHGAGNSVLIPVPLRLEQGWHIHGQMERGHERGHYESLQTLLTELFMRYGSGELSITVVDLVHYNLSCLGEYARLQQVASVGGILPFIQTARDRDELDRLSTRLISQYKAIRRMTGPKTVGHYNKHNADTIPYNILVLIRDQKTGFGATWPAGVENLVNNARAYGVTVLELDYVQDAPKRLDWTINTGKQTVEVACLPEIAIPDDFVDAVGASMTPKVLGTKYTQRHNPRVPPRSAGKRRPIEVPFAIDSADREISCRFEDDDFAAYIMGAAGSGKSTLLHALIAGLVSGYHPDEVELWLVDFKRTEFVRYANMCPPHVRYVLLEESEELLFDLVDELTRELERRLKLFAGKWSKLSEVPPEEGIPALFVIIDEFAQVSQHLRETRGSGLGFDYTLKLENLLAKGRAAGIKFIFASQSYSTGVAGLTETARKQIKMRFALRNTSQEIRDTLGLMHNQITDELLAKVASIQKYQTIFVRSNPSGGMPIVDLYNNEYLTYDELDQFIEVAQNGLKPVQSLEQKPDDHVYLDKHRVLLVDDRPYAFSELVDEYRQFESTLALRPEYSDIDDEDLLLYPGVPCSFNQAKPLVLRYGDGQNILLVDRSREDQASIALSLIRSWAKYDRDLANVEVWASSRSPILRRYGKEFKRVTCVKTPDEVCRRIQDLQGALNSFDTNDRLIIVFDLPDLIGDCNDYASMTIAPPVTETAAEPPQDDWEGLSLFDLIEARLAGKVTDEDIEAYNKSVEQSNPDFASSKQSSTTDDTPQLQSIAREAKKYLEELLQRGPRRGIHTLATFNRASDFESMRIKVSLFEHRMAASLSRMDSGTILGNRSADGLEPGTFVYTDGERKSVMRPHIYKGIPNNGWALKDGTVTRTTY